MPVVDEGVEQAGQERRPHDGELLRQRVGDRDQTVGRRERLGRRALDEREGLSFLESGAGQDVSNQPPAHDAGCMRRRRRAKRRQGRRNAIEAPMPADLLDQIGLTLDVHAERRHGDGPAGSGRGRPEPESRQQSGDVRVRHGGPEQPIEARATQHQRPRLAWTGVHVDDRLDELAPARRSEEFQRARDRANGRVEIGAALETYRGFGLEGQPPARHPDLGGLEPRAFERNVRGRSRHLGRGAPHHAGDRDGAFRVSDDEHGLVERTRLSVECREPLAGTRPAHVYLRPGKLRQIERVHGMTHFEHHVIGDVHDVVDWADARLVEALGQPGWRGSDPDRRHRERVPATARVVDRHAHSGVRRRRGARCLRGAGVRRRRPERQVERRRRLAREAVHAQAIRPVGRDLDVDDVVGDALDREAARRETVGDDRGIAGRVDELTQPGQGSLHSGICSRKRKSFS